LGAVRQAELGIVGDAGRQVGLLRVGLLPHALGTGATPPLLDLRQEPERDPVLEPVQLLEGHEYRYEIELSGDLGHVETDRPEVFETDSEHGTHGRLRPRLYTGMLPVTIRAGGANVERVALEVRSRKLEYLRH